MIGRPQRPRIQRRWFVIGGIVLLLFISISSIVRFYTDLLWFGELGFTNIFWKILWTRVGVGVVGGALAGIVVFANLEVARRAAPQYRFVAGGDITEQYRTAFRPYARLANVVMAAIVALFTGLSTSGTWERYLLWRNARPFGVDAPAPFGRDVSFYVFSIPFQRSVLSWLFGVLVVSLLLAAVAHLFNGSIQPEANRIRVGAVVKVHVSVLLGLIALLKAWAYRLDVFELVFSPRGVVTGASYTDVHAQRPALSVLFFIALIVAGIFFLNVFRRFQGWLLPGAALALWAFASILLGAIIPAAVQRFQVTPNESVRERPFIRHNIAMTRRAFGMDDINTRSFKPQESLDAETVEGNRGTIDNVRVWDPEVLHPTYQRLQAIRTYYEFDDVDIDRYKIDGRLRQVMLAPREVDPSKLEARAQNWVNTQLTYTHGYGIVANASNSITSEGLPNFLVRDLPPKGREELNPKQAGIYYGERLAGYSVVNTRQKEIDYPTGEQALRRTTYDGKGGIALSNVTRRLAFAARFGDTDLLLSRFITPSSRVIMRRNIRERAQVAAPFLRYDADPYIVASDDKLYWVLDAYTVSDRFPYSERIDTGQLFGTQGTLRGDVNYIRNSVKVVIDAFDGTMHFYLVDPTDALASTYQAAFPNLFTSDDEMPSAIREHLRYPEDMFMLQAWQYRRYHINEPEEFYAQEDAWDIPIDPTESSGQNRVFMKPYYVVMQLPWEDKEEFLLMLPFTPKDRPILNGWIAARMDGEHYGEMVGLSFPRGVTIDSPQNVSAKINQTDEISEQFTLWDRAGSTVDHGPIFVIPIERTLVYIQPIYLRSDDAERALPELRRVIVVIGDKIGFEPTLEASLQAALSGEALTVEEQEEGEPAAPAAPTGNVAELLRQAVEHFERAEAALRDGDLATYQRENEAGRRAVEEAQEQSSS